MTDHKSNNNIQSLQGSTTTSTDPRLSNEETKMLFIKMANSKSLRLKNIEAHKLFGQGVWLIQAKSAAQLRTFDVSRAIYVPMGSLPMFFTNNVLLKERIDPSREMLIAATYIVFGENSLSYVWTKAIVGDDSSKKVSSTPRKVVQAPSPTQVVVEKSPNQPSSTPRVNLPPVVNSPGGKSPFRLRTTQPRRSGATVVSEPSKKLSNKKR